jgi:hypothetical protein
MRREVRERRAKVRCRVVAEFDDQRMAIERSLDDAPLHAFAAPVHESNVAKAGLCGRIDVLAHDGRDVSRRERVEIELAFDWNPDRIVSHGQRPFGFATSS